ncbi:MAG: hypothetical protein ACI8X5_003651 [Planctomycetota bacterium]|jgi:hypothetical protein
MGGGADAIVNSYAVNGTYLADGRFNLMLPKWVEYEGNPNRQVVQDLAYDGATLISGTVGAETYQVYASTFKGIDGVLLNQARFLSPLRMWLSNPFDICRLEKTDYEVESLADGVTRITESYPEPDFPAWAGTVVYTINSAIGGGMPTRIEVFSTAGELLRRREYGKYRQLRDGVWRPFFLEESRFKAGEQEPHFTIRTTLHSIGKTFTELADAEAVFIMPEPASGWWVVHE